MIPVDVTFHPSWWNAHAGISFKKEFFFNEKYRLEADVEMRKTLNRKFGEFGLGEKNPAPRPLLGSDLLACGFLHSEIMGCEVRYSDVNPPEVIAANRSTEYIEHLKTPNLQNVEIWNDTLNQMERLYDKFGYVESCINLMGIQNIAIDIRGSELFIDYFDNQSLALHLLEVCTDLSIQMGKQLAKYTNKISAGVTSIVKQTVPEQYLTSNCSVDMVSLDTYEEFLLPFDKMLADAFGPFGVHHCGKTMEHVVEGYAKIPQLVFAEVGAFSDLETVRKCMPDIFLNARYSPVRLKDASFDEIKNDLSKILLQGQPRNLLSISCVGIDADIPDSKIKDFLRACREAEEEYNCNT